MIQIKVWKVPLSAASVEKVRYDIQDDLIVMTFHNNQILCHLFLIACEQCMKPADVYCMECRNNYCR